MKSLVFAASVAALSLVGLPATAALLVGTSTFAAADDITVVAVDGGRRLEFLDLTSTVNMTVPAALSAVGGGFRWAREAEVAQLFEAFGVDYVSPPTWSYIPVPGTVSASQKFIDYLGDTHPLTNLGMPAVAAIGFIDDGTADGYRSCISVNGCNPLNFVQDWSPHGSATAGSSIDTGVFLVRDAVAVSEPGGAALVALTLSALAASGAGSRSRTLRRLRRCSLR